MNYNQYQIKAAVWLYPGMAAWHFVSIPKEQSEEIETLFSDRKRGWGSFKVSVTIGKTTWETSIFPDKKTNTYLLPIKAEVRKKEHITVDDIVSLSIELKS